MDGKKATIAMLDLFNDKVVSVDYNRDQGFLTGMGIDVADKTKNGDEAKTGKYTGGKGGDYEIVCNEPTQGAQDEGRTAMETCLAKSKDINLVYTHQRAGRRRRLGGPQGGRRHRHHRLGRRRLRPGHRGGEGRHDRRDLAAVPGQDGRAGRRGDRQVQAHAARSRR